MFKEIGDRYKYLREEHTQNNKNGKWMTTRELSVAMTGYEHYASEISRIENSKREPNIKDLQIYHKYFKTLIPNFSYEFLLGETDSLEYKNITISKDLGLSEDVINALKFWIEKNPRCNIAFVLNHIFKIGCGYAFLNALSHYFYVVNTKFMMSKIGKKGRKNATISTIEDNKVSILSNEEGSFTEIRIEDVEYIFQQKLYAILSKIKEKLKVESLQCETFSYNGFNEDLWDNFICNSGIINDVDFSNLNDAKFKNILEKIRKVITDGKYST